MEAEFAVTKGFAGLDRWTEGPAGQGAGGIEIAASGGRIEDGAGFVVAKILKPGERRFVVE